MENCWGKTLTKNKKQYLQSSFMSAKDMHQYVNLMDYEYDIFKMNEYKYYWTQHSYYNFLLPLANQRQRKLRMLSIGCGNGEREYQIIHNEGWCNVISELVGLEFDSSLIKTCTEKFSEYKEIDSKFFSFDFNNINHTFGEFDVIFFCHSLHHCKNIENLFIFTNNSLIDNESIIIGVDHFGPCRSQYNQRLIELLNEVFDALPEHLKHKSETKLIMPSVHDMVKYDESESVRGGDLKEMFFSIFPNEYIRPLGGTLLRKLLSDRVNLFDNDNISDISILTLLKILEKYLIRSGYIESHDYYFILRKNTELQTSFI